MKRSYYISKNGTLKRKDNSLCLDVENEEHKYIPVEDVESIYVFGEMNFNSKLINFLGSEGVVVHYFNYYGFYTGSFYPREQLNSGFLLTEQAKHYLDLEKRMVIAKEIINSAAYNIYRNLRYYNERGKDLSKIMENISILREKISKCNTIPELMGIEGNIRKHYYDAFPLIINQEIDFDKRTKRPPDNMINSLISFINMLVYTTVLGEIYHTQLSPVLSFLHQPGERRFSLSLDIAEVFKPLIADRIIFSMLNKNQLTEKDFLKELNFVYIKENSRKEILKAYDDRLQQTIHHKKLDKDVSYKYLIRLELYKLVKHLTNETEYEGFKMWW